MYLYRISNSGIDSCRLSRLLIWWGLNFFVFTLGVLSLYLALSSHLKGCIFRIFASKTINCNVFFLLNSFLVEMIFHPIAFLFKTPELKYFSIPEVVMQSLLSWHCVRYMSCEWLFWKWGTLPQNLEFGFVYFLTLAIYFI